MGVLHRSPRGGGERCTLGIRVHFGHQSNPLLFLADGREDRSGLHRVFRWVLPQRDEKFLLRVISSASFPWADSSSRPSGLRHWSMGMIFSLKSASSTVSAARRAFIVSRARTIGPDSCARYDARPTGRCDSETRRTRFQRQVTCGRCSRPTCGPSAGLRARPRTMPSTPPAPTAPRPPSRAT